MRTLATKAEFDAVLSEGRTVIVDFTATWCGPCQRIAPAFEKLSLDFPHVTFVKVDVDENQETAMECGVSAMPTFKAYVAGKEVGIVRGADEAALRALVTQHQGDKWSTAGSGHTLGGGSGGAEADAAAPAMSERDKRLAALAKRGL
jgi:thioredoxin 1